MRNRNRTNSDSIAAQAKPSTRMRIADTIGISHDIALNLPRIVLIGNAELTLENYEGILEYSDSVIRISANGGGIKIEGRKLEIRTITSEMLFITGNIMNVCW